MNQGTIRIGTRGSKLALWQAYYVADLLKVGGWHTEIVEISTKGDQILDVSIAKIGSKGVFTEELEMQLRDGSIDIAVHSAKDMPSLLPEDLALIAFSEREKMHDVLVSDRDISLEAADFTIGTSSTRRIALLKHFFPNVKTVDMRGNLQTRLGKMERGDCDALWLAYAGVHRMGYQDRIKHHLPLEPFTPAVGQGSVTIECARSLSPQKQAAIRELVNDEATEQCLLTERAFLRKLEGGCSVPVFGLTTRQSGKLRMRGGVVSLDGKRLLTATHTGQDPVSLGLQVAEDLLAQGADQILQEIKAN